MVNEDRLDWSTSDVQTDSIGGDRPLQKYGVFLEIIDGRVVDPLPGYLIHHI